MTPSTSPRAARAAVTETALTEMRSHAPDGSEVLALETLADLETIDFLVPRARDWSIVKLLPRASRLAVVQVLSAGVDWIEPHVPPHAALCSARGARDAPARGPVLDTAALLPEVTSGRLRAVLDVTDPEPLPDDHPLWSAPGVLAITPHIAGDSPRGQARAARLAAEQFARWCAGEPLHNVVRSGSR